MIRKALLAIGLLWAAGLAAAEERVIAALGDSLTQGYGLPQEAGFVPQLETWLESRGAEVRLINAGVSGDTTAGGLARVGWTLTPEVEGLIVTLGGNDLLRALPPETTRENLAGILEAAAAADVPVLLIGMEAPGNYGADYKAAFDGLYPALAEDYGTLFLPSFFAGLSDAGGADLAALRPYLQADGIHPNAEGVEKIVSAVGPAVEDLIARIEAD